MRPARAPDQGQTASTSKVTACVVVFVMTLVGNSSALYTCLVKKSLLLLALSAVLLLPSAIAAADSVTGKNGLLSVPAIAVRFQRDHRMDIYPEKYGSDQATHVGLFLSDQSVPYMATLGWFSIAQTKDGASYLDEFGERIPELGEKATRTAYNKADLLAVRGFDTLTDGHAKQALSAFEDAVKLAPQSPKAHNNFGICLAMFEQLPRAQAELDLAIKLKPDYTAALANRAWLDLVLNRPQSAVETAKKALALKHDCKSAWLAITKAYLVNDQIQDAKISAQELARRWPNDAVIVELAGEAFLAAGDLKQAKQYYLKYALLNPGDVAASVKLAEIYQQLGDLDNALKYARGAAHEHAGDSSAHLVLARLLEANHDYRPAEVQYERAIETGKTMEERVAAQGPMLRVLFQLNKLPDADKLSKKWAAEKGAPADCHYNRAWVASQIGGAPAKTEAISEYQKALALKSGMPEVHYNLGLLLADQGRKSEAEKELKLFIQQAPNDPDIQKARELLGKLSH
jgi:tetratricopeptide (TPR) repeat protein